MARCTLGALIGAAAILLVGSLAAAQGVGGPVRQDSGPLRELSTNTRDGSRPVRESAAGVREDNAGPLGGNSVRGSVTGDLVSGPVADVSGGPVTAGFRSSGRRTITDISAGAVTKDIDSPLREVVAAPVHNLGPLQEQLRGIQPLPREATMPVEPVANGEAIVPDEGVDADQVETRQIATEPQDQVEGEAEATQAATEPADTGGQESDERPESYEPE